MAKNQKQPNKIKNPTGLRSVEKLNHFRCLFCDKWWSIGDADARKQEWFCPWCGEKQKFALIKK